MTEREIWKENLKEQKKKKKKKEFLVSKLFQSLVPI
jgi:hypothetical protein